MDSEFAAAQVHLELARQCLLGDDETSRRAVEALDLLIEAVATAGFSQKKITPLRRIASPKAGDS